MYEINDLDWEFICKVRKVIEENFYWEIFLVKEFSEMMNMEYVIFYRKFKVIMNENVKKVI